jgi:hypothetical protein
MLIHPRTKDLVLGTHGRSIWILDDASSIADWSPVIAAKPSYFFPPRRATLMQYWEDISNTAQSMYAAENPADGAEFTYHLGRPARSVRLIVRRSDGKVIREIAGGTSAGVIHRVTWDLRHVPPPATAGGGAFAGGEEGGGGGGAAAPEGAAGGRGGGRGGGGARADAPIQLPIPTHDIGNRGPYVAPGTFKVTLDVDGDTTTRSFEVRADPTLTVTLAQHKAREAFLLDVQAVQIQIEQRITELRARRAATSGAEADRFLALERRLSAGRDAPRGKLGGIARTYNGTGAQQGSFFPPTTIQRQTLAEAKAELVAIEKELKK